MRKSGLAKLAASVLLSAWTVRLQAVVSSGDYVRRGLFAQYDALENSGGGAHDASATKWSDLSGNGHDGTLGADVTWERDALVYVSEKTSTSNKPVKIGTGPTDLIAGRTFSVELVLTPGRGGVRQVLFGTYDGTDGFTIELRETNYLRAYFDAAPNIETTEPLSVSGGSTVSLTTDSKVHRLYRDGQEFLVNTTPNTGIMAKKVQTVLGGEPSTKRDLSFRGRIHACRIYDRVLTADEVKLNTALDQVRFFGADPQTVDLPDGYLFDAETNFLCVARVRSADADRGGVRLGEGEPSADISVTNRVGAGGTLGITAVAAAGYRFDHWVGSPRLPASGGRDTENLTIGFDGPVGLTAVFVPENRPANPEEAAFIEADGQSAVDTDWLATPRSAFVADYAWVGTADSQDGIFGTRVGDVRVALYINGNNHDQSWTYSNGSTVKYNATGIYPDEARHLATLDSFAGKVFLATGLTTDYTAASGPVATLTATRPIALFGSPASAEDSFMYMSTARLYSFEIRESGSVAGFFAPYRAADGIGFMDVATGKVHLNATSEGSLTLNDGYGTAEDYFVEDGTLHVRLYACARRAGTGSVAIDGVTADAGSAWTSKGSAAFVALPAKGFRFVRWEGDIAFLSAGTAEDASVTVDATRVRSLKAVFERVGSYVQDGLVVWYDGIENAGVGRHEANPSVWADLTDNGHDGTLMPDLTWTANAWQYTNEAAEHEKKLVNAGTAPADVISGTKSFSIECVCRPRSVTTRTALASQYEGVSTSGFSFEITADKKLRAWFTNKPDFKSKETLSADSDVTATLTTDGSRHVFYENGVAGSVNTTANTGKMVKGDLIVGGEPCTLTTRDMNFRGTFYAFRFYNRPLTADEAKLNAALDQVRFFGADPQTVDLPPGCRFDADTNVVFAKTAVWTGAEDRSPANPANWQCTDAFGRPISGVVPNGLSEVILSGDVDFEVPAGTPFSCLKLTIGTIRLTADCDWRGLGPFDLPEGALIDLNGHALSYLPPVGTSAHAAEVTDSAGDGELRLFGAGADLTFTNDKLAFTGKMRLVWTGPGTLLAEKSGQTYTGGTVLADGKIWIASGTDTTTHAPSKCHQFGAAGSEIVVTSGGSFNIRGNYEFATYPFVLDGGILYNGIAQSKLTWNGIGDITLTDDSDLTVNKSTVFGSSLPTTIDCGGKTLTATIANGSSLYLRTPTVANGTFRIPAGTGSLVMRDGDKDCRTADFDIACGYVVPDGITVAVRDFACALPADDDAGAGLTRVCGRFRPANAWFHDTELEDGATLDLAAWTAAFPLESGLTPKACVRKRLTFANGSRIAIDARGRTLSEGDLVVSWSAVPANIGTVRFEFVGDETMPFVASDGIRYGGVPRTEVATAVWCGGASSDLASPSNWQCADFDGRTVAGAVPGRYAMVRLAGDVSFDAPANSVWWRVTFGETRLVADCDWTAFGPLVLNEGSLLDLNGHRLDLTGAPGETPYAATVTNGAAPAKALLALGVPVDTALTNTRVTVSSDVSLDIVGPGAYVFNGSVLSRAADGTLVKGGTGTYVLPAGVVPARLAVEEGTLSFADAAVTASVSVAENATVELGATALTCPFLSGSGTVRGGSLRLVGLVCPGGNGAVGTLRLDSAATLTGRLSVELGDLLEIGHPLRVSSAEIVVTDLQDLTGDAPFEIAAGASVTGWRKVTDNLDGTGWKLLGGKGGLSIVPPGTPIPPPEESGLIILFR